MYYVYVIKNEKDQLYFGYTTNLEKRIINHNNNGTKSTRGHKWEVVYYEAFKSEIDARNRERQLKKHGSGKRWLKERIKESIK